MKKKPRIPSSTYRLQLGQSFTLEQAAALVDYLEALGISDCYVSPILRASPKAGHPYAVIDPGVVDPQLGDEEALGRLAEALKSRQMGLVLDIVPNHMFIADDANAWWSDLLENGPCSVYADYFDVDWDPPRPQLKNQVLLPILGDQFGRVLESGDLRVLYSSGAFFVSYHDRCLPVNPRAWVIVLDLVDKLVSQQLQESDSHLLELKSIVTALHHLPGMAERELAQVEERRREKEIVKQRLEALVAASPEIELAVGEALHVINGHAGNVHSYDQLEELLEWQSYRLCFWRVANDEINYRRFFDVNELACLRIEEPRVFAEVHNLIFRYVRRGWVTGLRVDHIDGLFDPERYLRDLQLGCSISLEDDIHKGAKPVYVLVEKIFTGDEVLRRSWPIHGTTGYDFANAVNGLFVASDQAPAFMDLYSQFTRVPVEISELIFRAKQFILRVSMSSELHVLARELDRIAHQARGSRDFTRESLEYALHDIIACFPVYRSYVRVYDGSVEEEDRAYILRAVKYAKRRNPATSRLIFDFIARVLLLEVPEGLTDDQLAMRRHFVMRAQQLTGPVMAKGLEDTAFYRFHPLASLNEVGGDPYRFGLAPKAFHERMAARHREWPHTLSATATHDTKRGEDVRARISALSEIPEEWGGAVARWHRLNLAAKQPLEDGEVPSRNDEYLLYQTLVGMWPFHPKGDAERDLFTKRIQGYMDKATREAKVYTSWINPNELYDAGVQRYVQRVLDPSISQTFLEDLETFVRPIQRAGIWNSLAQVAIKAFAPGVPDFYQGTELWQFVMVDPDNREPVDFARRREALEALQRGEVSLEELVATAEDGRIKLFLTYTALHFRRSYPVLFRRGSYLPLRVRGAHEDHIIAFARKAGNQAAFLVAGRFFLRLGGHIGESIWKDTRVCLPKSLQGGSWRDLLSGREHLSSGELKACDLFSHLPVALLQWIAGS